jgi:hypothetical protein
MTVETITVNEIEYTWYNYTEPLEILNAEDINNAQANISTIKAILTDKGYSLAELTTETASYNSELVKIIDILNAVEYNLDVINNTPVRSIYYGESYRAVAGGLAHNTKQIWRWFEVLNDVIKIVTGKVGKWGYLLCLDGYPTINGKRLILRGDLIG